MQMLCYRVEYGLQKQKPHNLLCGLGSWREQQRAIEWNQKFACRLTRPHRKLWGSTIPFFRLDATLDGINYTQFY